MLLACLVACLAGCGSGPSDRTVEAAVRDHFARDRKGSDIRMAMTRMEVRDCRAAAAGAYECSFDAELYMDARYGGPASVHGNILMRPAPAGWTYDPAEPLHLRSR